VDQASDPHQSLREQVVSGSPTRFYGAGSAAWNNSRAIGAASRLRALFQKHDDGDSRRLAGAYPANQAWICPVPGSEAVPVFPPTFIPPGRDRRAVPYSVPLPIPRRSFGSPASQLAVSGYQPSGVTRILPLQGEQLPLFEVAGGTISPTPHPPRACAGD